MQAIRIKDRDQLVALQKLREQLTERQNRQHRTGAIRRLVNRLTQGMEVAMNGSLQQCRHCGRTGQEKIPVRCKHCQKASQRRSRTAEMAR